MGGQHRFQQSECMAVVGAHGRPQGCRAFGRIHRSLGTPDQCTGWRRGHGRACICDYFRIALLLWGLRSAARSHSPDRKSRGAWLLAPIGGQVHRNCCKAVLVTRNGVVVISSKAPWLWTSHRPAMSIASCDVRMWSRPWGHDTSAEDHDHIGDHWRLSSQ